MGWNLRKTCLLAAFLLGANLINASALRASEADLEKAAIHEAVEALAGLLEGNYVFPDIAAAYGAHLREGVKSGAYDKEADPVALAARLSRELNDIHEDAHLRVTYSEGGAGRGSRGSRRPPSGPAPVDGATWIADGVAFVAITALPRDPAVWDELRGILDGFAGAKALILDLRYCRGGGLELMDVLFSRLYGTRVHLVTMDTRADAFRPQGERLTLTNEDAPEGIRRQFHWSYPENENGPLTDVPVYVLTGRTASACEHMSLALKITGRGTLIGERTIGAGHYGGVIPFGSGFRVFVPVGRTYDPKTGEDWEGTGVAPDIEVSPDDALCRALSELGIEREVPQLPKGKGGDYAGAFGAQNVTYTDGTLFIQHDGSPDPDNPLRRFDTSKMRLEPTGEDRFTIPRYIRSEVVFTRGPDGSVSAVEIHRRGRDPELYQHGE